VKHAGAEALDQLEDLLGALRRHEGLSEKSRGCFYRKSASFLHFHEDPAGLFADVKLAGTEFDRLRVSTAKQRAALLAAVARALAAAGTPSPRAARSARSRDTRRGA
jgi:hypothetical protein